MKTRHEDALQGTQSRLAYIYTPHMPPRLSRYELRQVRDFTLLALAALAILSLVASLARPRTAPTAPYSPRLPRADNRIPSPCALSSVECAGEPRTITRVVTAYTARREETDSTPCITASNYDVCTDTTIKVAATNELPLGTRILIDDTEYIVLDRMNPRYPDRYDILMSSYESARAYGIQEKKITILYD